MRLIGEIIVMAVSLKLSFDILMGIYDREIKWCMNKLGIEWGDD